MDPTFFNSFFERLANGTFDFANDTFAVALVAAANAPLVTNSDLIDLTLVDTLNLSSNLITVTSATQTDGVLTVEVDNTALLATGGDVGPFRYVVIYDDTSATDALVCFYQLPGDVTIPNTQTVTIIYQNGELLTVSV